MVNRLVNIFKVVSIVITISVFVAYPSFKLALFGDDWQQIWNYFHYIETPNITNHLAYFVSGYGAFEMTTGILYGIFGHNYKMYYIFSYLYKLIAAFSVWPLIFYLTRSKLASFYGSLFLSVTLIGIESTNWVVNSPAYLSIANLSLFFFFFIKSREDLKPVTFGLAILFFYLAHIFAPLRMTGLLPFTFFMEAFMYIKSRKLRLSFFRLFTIIIIFVIISGTSAAQGRSKNSLLEDASSILNSGLSKIATMSQSRSDFLFYPVMTIGRLVIPYSVKPQVPTLFFGLIIFLGTLILNIPKGRKIILTTTLSLGIWSLISWIIYSINKSTLLLQDAISLAIGGYFLIIGIILMIYNRSRLISTSLLLGVFWTIFSFIFTWIRAPETLHPTEHRYLTPAAVGIAIFFASIIGLGHRLRNRINLFLLIIPFIIINILTTRSFFTDVVENSHGAQTMNKIWSSFPYIPEIGKTEKTLVFYFDSTPGKGPLKHHSLTFGFPYRIALMYNIHDKDVNKSLKRLPMVSNDWSDIVSAVSDGNSLARSGYPKEKVPVENVYSFYLTSENDLINTTSETRNKLRKETLAN